MKKTCVIVESETTGRLVIPTDQWDQKPEAERAG